MKIHLYFRKTIIAEGVTQVNAGKTKSRGSIW